MPIYEYKCSQCGNQFEVLHRINEKPKLKCDSCGSTKVTRLLSAGAFVFKGSGFYATDYKAKENKANGKAKPAEKASCPACSEGGGCGSSASKN